MAGSDTPSLGRASALVGSAALLSRVLGFARDMGLAAVLGAGPAADIFLAAFRFPNVMRRLFAEGALATAIVPEYVALRNGPHPRAADRLARSVFLLVLAWGLPLLVLALAGAHRLVPALVPGMEDPLWLDRGATLFRICLPYGLAACLAALLMAVLNGRNRFLLPALAPGAFNICMLCGVAVCLLPATGGTDPGLVLAWAVLVAGCVQVLMLLAPTASRLAAPLPPLPEGTRPGRTILRTLPAVAAGSAFQCMLLLSVAFASFQDPGDISRLYFADRLAQFPLAVAGASLSIVALTRLSELAASNDTAGFRTVLGQALGICLFIAVPSALGLAVLRVPIVDLLFGHGSFDSRDVAATSRMLLCFAPAVVALSLNSSLVAAHLARNQLARSLASACFALVAFLAAALVLPRHMGSSGIALAASLGSWTNALCLLPGLGVLPGLARSLTRILPAAALMGGGVWLQILCFPRWPSPVHAASIPVWAVVYAALALLLRSPEARSLRACFRRPPSGQE